MTTYTDPFGGSAPQPADVSFAAIALTTATTQLAWPSVAQLGEVYLPRLADFTTVPLASVVRLPAADQVSTGQDALLTNRGANSFSLQTADGVVIATVAPGDSLYIYLTDNTTNGGSWSTTQFGVGVSSVDAGALAGQGLRANGTQLEVDLNVVTVAASSSIDSTFRAETVVWTGGTGTLTLPLTTDVGDGFFFGVRNQGTGVLLLDAQGAELIDGSGGVSLQPQESCLVFAGAAAAYYTVGRGRNQSFGFTLLIKAVTGGSVVLTPTEAANVVQRYTGALVSNCVVTLPSVVQVYYVSNQTTGAFSLTFRTAGVGSTVVVPQGQNAILFCDGTNVINNSTTVSGLTALILNVGAVTAPSISFLGDTSTGIFQAVSGSTSFAALGSEIVRYTGVATAVNFLEYTAGVAGQNPRMASNGPTANVGMRITPKGAGAVNVDGPIYMANIGGFAGDPGYSFDSAPSTGLYLIDVNTFGIQVGAVRRLSLADSGGVTTVATFGDPLGINSYLTLSTNGRLNIAVPTSAGAVIGFDASLFDTTQNVTYQFGRTTTTSGVHRVQVLRGDGTATTDHQLISGTSALLADLARNGGQLAVGGAAGGSVAAPCYSFSADLDTGLFYTGANEFAVALGGSQVVTFGATNLTYTTATAGGGLNVVCSDPGATGARITTTHSSASPAANDVIGEIRFNGLDSGAAAQTYGQILARILDPTAASEDGGVDISNVVAGATQTAIATRSGEVYFPNVGTTASAANAFLNNASSPANQILRSTSSLRYKKDVRDLAWDAEFIVSQLRPVVYRSKAEADDPELDWLGLIAEEVAVTAPRLVQYAPSESGPVPDGVQYDRLGVLLVAVVKRLLSRVAALEGVGA